MHSIRLIEKMLLENYESSIQLTVMTKNISRSSSARAQPNTKNERHSYTYTTDANKNPLTNTCRDIHTYKHLPTRSLLMNIAAPHNYIPLYSFFFAFKFYETRRDGETVRKRDPCVREHDVNIVVCIMFIYSDTNETKVAYILEKKKKMENRKNRMSVYVLCVYT